MPSFTPRSLPVLIGSLPLTDHHQAVEQIFEFTPQIPLWPQLPSNQSEGMLQQFLPGMPGVAVCENRLFIDTENEEFEADLLSFYEDYLMISEQSDEIEQSRFHMGEEEGRGLFTFLEFADTYRDHLTAVKGQITGPITFCTGLTDGDGRAIFYHDQLRDAAIKLIALKAKWQAIQMKKLGTVPLIFFDEPGLAGVGSSAFITITPEDIISALKEVFEPVHGEGGLTGVHVCANTEWSLIFDSGADVVSFDAYSYFDKFMLYPDHIKAFFERGGICASGIVPTTEEHIDAENVESIARKWFDQAETLERLGLSARRIYEQTLITPSCGTGTISEKHAAKVMELTRDVSARIRSQYL